MSDKMIVSLNVHELTDLIEKALDKKLTQLITVSSGVNVYISIDFVAQSVNRDHKVRSITDRQVLNKYYLKEGWLMFTPGSSTAITIKNSQNTGDLILDGAINDSIQIEKIGHGE